MPAEVTAVQSVHCHIALSQGHCPELMRCVSTPTLVLMPTIETNPLIAKLGQRGDVARSADVLAQVQMSSARFRSGDLVSRQSETSEYCVLLVEGFLLRSKEGSRGLQGVSIYMAGDLVGLESLHFDRAENNLEALGLVEVLLIDSADLKIAMASSGRVAAALSNEFAIQAAILEEWLVNVGTRPAPERVAHLLCEVGFRWEQSRLGDRTRFELPLTHEQLGACVGATPQHVSTVLRGLASRGLIERDRRTIRIVDWERLSEVAAFDSGYLHLPSSSAQHRC